MRLAGKTALVTGGASGFGAGIVRRFRAEGAAVLIADIELHARRRRGRGSRRRRGHGRRRAATPGSPRSRLPQRPPSTASTSSSTTPASPTSPPRSRSIEEAEFDRVLRINAKSVYLTARHFVPAMKARGSGAILNIASTAGLSPRPRLSWYNASKGWMITATKAMAVELAPFGVRVNALCPVAGETPLLRTFLGEDTPEMRAKFLATIPLGRFSTPEDLASAATFLCSDEASMLTGVALEVDGGRCI